MLLAAVAVAIFGSPQLHIETVRRLSYARNDHRVLLRRLEGSAALFFQSKMSCDVDGSPNAYHPWDDGLSIDVIESAGGKRVNNLPRGPLEVLPSPDVVVYMNGQPYIQPDGKWKGFYVSETSYENKLLPATSSKRYLDARKIQYIVLPGGLVPEAGIGDLAIVYDPASHRHVCAVFGDVGPSDESGEVSLATIKRLGLPATDGKSSPGQCRDDLFFLVFPQTASLLDSADPWPHAQRTIDALAEAEFIKWGGAQQVEAILHDDPQGGSVPDTPANASIYNELAALRAEGLSLPYGFDLPIRCGGAGGRLPCATEVVDACHAAILAAQKSIGKVERAVADLHTLDTWPQHLVKLERIIDRFPAEAFDEGSPLSVEQTRVQALLARIRDLRAMPPEVRALLFEPNGLIDADRPRINE
ncbi:MAG: hypothetical protein ACYC96_12125 [Fimbriimonadaceae bacterium]